jgi:hypothetical protein
LRDFGGLRLLPEDLDDLFSELAELGGDLGLGDGLDVGFLTCTLTVLMTVGGLLLLKNMIDAAIETQNQK